MALSLGDIELSLEQSAGETSKHASNRQQRNRGEKQQFEKQQRHQEEYDNTESESKDDNENNNDESQSSRKKKAPSNQQLLGTAFVSFFVFAILQTVAAFLAGSRAMLGDSAAMMVDAITYLFNYVAENKKKQYDENYLTKTKSLQLPPENIQISSSLSKKQRVQERRILVRDRKKYVLQLEIIPPLISVTTLIAVTTYVSYQSFELILLDLDRVKSEQDIPNIHLMLGFSIGNLLLDFVNVLFFARAKHLFGYATNNSASSNHKNYKLLPVSNEINHDDDIFDHHNEIIMEVQKENPQEQRHQQHSIKEPEKNNESEELNKETSINTTKISIKGQDIKNSFSINCSYPQRPQEINQQTDKHINEQKETLVAEGGSTKIKSVRTNEFEQKINPSTQNLDDMGQQAGFMGWEMEEDDEKNESDINLNMCSAYTHVLADTFRSIAVIIAALMAQFLEIVTPEVADATAALIVSLLIILSLIPLMKGMIQNLQQLRTIRIEEKLEEDHEYLFHSFPIGVD